MAFLARAAAERCHEVVLCVSESSAGLARRIAPRSTLVSMVGDIDAFSRSEEARVLLRRGRTLQVMRTFMSIVQAHEEENFARLLEATSGADIVVAQALAYPQAAIAAEHRQAVLAAHGRWVGIARRQWAELTDGNGNRTQRL